ncbi:uroporphyrinogen-III synthase [Methylomicrobium sp. RS1]|uniref:uroporphyrinogen-III synthase n=1 Tax=Candidatus Methylomicrobium oryzae TaxID=2802053 RepID=UPI0019206187|nr:uroporphyrinogen-III synthase [Methylomicrobium sp. RS1]MBL1264429.1 uroporphyrinogen-III synthase [Methylomicrobium sp. RS1]
MISLNGAHILVTRPQHQAYNLCRLIERQQGVAVAFPTLEIVAAADRVRIAQALANLHRFQWVVFISANAVNFALLANDGKIDQFRNTRIAAIGAATARALAAAGLTADLVPADGSDSRALLAMPALQQVSGQRILIVRGAGGLDTLREELVNRGANVDYLDVYRRTRPLADPAPVLDLLEQKGLGLIIVTSGEALKNLLIMLGEKGRNQALATPLIVVSGRIRQMAEDSGFERIYVTDSPSDTAILEKIITWATGEKSGRTE